MESIYADDPGKDEAEKVKRCIVAYHKAQGIRFALLVGDSDTFPVRFTKTDRKTAAAYNTAFYATDLYYAALYKNSGVFDDWDWSKNGYYGELHGESHTGTINIDKVNLKPVIGVGRIPSSNLAETNRYIQKIIRYETKALKGSWVKKAMLIATHDWHSDACHTQGRIAKDYLTNYTSTLLFTKESPCTNGQPLKADIITKKINAGVGIVSYIGHGSTGALAIPGGWWGIDKAKNLTNIIYLPIMVASACSTAEFATQPPYHPYVDKNGKNHQGTNNGEVFTSTPPQPACLQTTQDPDSDLARFLTVGVDNGVVMYLGGITGMQYSQPLEYFFKGFQKFETVGEVWQWMVDYYYAVENIPATLNAEAWYVVARMHQPWKYMLFGDPSLRINGAVKGRWSPQQMTRGDRGTSRAPTLAAYNNRLYMAWKGKSSDVRIFYSSFANNIWNPQKLTRGDRGTSNAPTLAVYKNKLYKVWKGKGSDVKIFFSFFNGKTWSAQKLTRGDRGTSNTPALAVYNNKLYMVWKGKGKDVRIFYSHFDGSTWSPQKLTRGDRGTSNAPALAVYNNKLYMVWKGKGKDVRIFYSHFDGSTWSPQKLTRGDRGTSHAPALAVYNNKLYMVWKGKGKDVRIFYSSFNGSTWSPQYLTSGDRGTSTAPALEVFDDKLFLVWKGKGSDPRIFYSYLYI